MGLDIDINGYELWHGGYLSFDALREVIGNTFNQCNNFADHSELQEFLDHSDCNGELDWKICEKLSETLYSLLPHITEEKAWGHVVRQGGMQKCVEKLAQGFKLAYSQKENPRFH